MLDSTGRTRVLLVEDDEATAALVARYFEANGVGVAVVPRGDLAVDAVIREQPDLVLLDRMLPGLDGIGVCRRLRERTHVPIVMLTARGAEDDRVESLESGADDHVCKPFSPRELLARVRAHVRRARCDGGPRLEIGDLAIDRRGRTATLGGKPLALTEQEFLLLAALAERPGEAVGREQLLVAIHGDAACAFDRSIDVHVHRLRHKLGDDPSTPRFLRTIRGRGYLLARPAA